VSGWRHSWRGHTPPARRSDECLGQILENTTALLEGETALRVEQGGSAVDPGEAADAAPAPGPAESASVFHREIARRLRRWHRRISEQWREFDSLDEAALHDLRKRIKRQRYAVEFFAPVLPRKSVTRYLEPLTAIQERMGELNDLFVARSHYQALVETDPAAWFALGWLAARLAEVRAAAKPALRELARAAPPAP
jgi:CHAD domain-containing protein